MDSESTLIEVDTGTRVSGRTTFRMEEEKRSTQMELDIVESLLTTKGMDMAR